mmetsp:Transcript_30412/g.68735  ORF Transcript_30412/g.68735 Transcript_30412/m.68735 type:complete len:86 (+) Transcript_30412:38-295(+)
MQPLRDVPLKQALRWAQSAAKDPATKKAARSWMQQYHDKYMKKDRWEPLLHAGCIIWGIGYLNDYFAHLQHTKKHAGGPEIIWAE